MWHIVRAFYLFGDKIKKKIIFKSIYLCIWIFFCTFAR